MGNFFDQFDGGLGVTTKSKVNSADATAANARASAGKSVVTTDTLKRELPYVAPRAEANTKKAIAGAESATLKLEQDRATRQQMAAQQQKEAERLADLANRILSNPALPQVIGRNFNPAIGMVGHYDEEKDTGVSGKPRLLWGGTDAATLVSDIAQLQRKAFMEGRGAMKGTGALSNIESLKGEGAIANLDPTQSPQAFAANVIRFRDQARQRAQMIDAINREMRQRSIKSGLAEAPAPVEGAIHEDAQGNRAIYKNGTWVEIAP